MSHISISDQLVILPIPHQQFFIHQFYWLKDFVSKFLQIGMSRKFSSLVILGAQKSVWVLRHLANGEGARCSDSVGQAAT